MEATDITIQVLREIRDEIRNLKQGQAEVRDEIRGLKAGQAEVRDEIRGLKAGQAETNERLDTMERRQTETEVRLATELVAVADAVRQVRDLLRDGLIPTVKDHEQRIVNLEEQTGA